MMQMNGPLVVGMAVIAACMCMVGAMAWTIVRLATRLERMAEQLRVLSSEMLALLATSPGVSARILTHSTGMGSGIEPAGKLETVRPPVREPELGKSGLGGVKVKIGV